MKVLRLEEIKDKKYKFLAKQILDFVELKTREIHLTPEMFDFFRDYFEQDTKVTEFMYEGVKIIKIRSK